MSLGSDLQQLILDEIAKTFGTAPNGLVRRICGSVFALPTGRFGRLFAAADRAVEKGARALGALDYSRTWASVWQPAAPSACRPRDHFWSSPTIRARTTPSRWHRASSAAI